MVNIAAIGKGLKTTAEIVAAVTTVIGSAGALKEAVQPIIDSDEGQVAIDKSKDTVVGLKQKAAAAVGKRGHARAAKKEAKELAKQLKSARQVILEGASQTTTYKDFAKNRARTDNSPMAIAAGLYNGSGCFAIATYRGIDFDKDLTDYLYVYVGKGEILGQAIESACSRSGDPDLYADTKYKQNVWIYAFPCVGDEIEKKYEALTALFLESEDKNDKE